MALKTILDESEAEMAKATVRQEPRIGTAKLKAYHQEQV